MSRYWRRLVPAGSVPVPFSSKRNCEGNCRGNEAERKCKQIDGETYHYDSLNKIVRDYEAIVTLFI